LINREESYIYIYELKVAAFSCQIDDLVVPIWPYQFFNALQSNRRSDRNTMLTVIGSRLVTDGHDSACSLKHPLSFHFSEI